MRTLTVDLADRSYPIKIGAALLSQPDSYTPYIRGRRACVVSNTTVSPLYLSALKNALSDYQVDEVILPDGEPYKNLDTLNQIFTNLLEKQHNRQTTLIALGGGVVGDMTGFAAACYQRGVDFIQVPTTLLAQVDSSVGGKTAVNHPMGKNMIGAFYQPKAVIIDTDVLATLPAREYVAGVAEVIKYGAINDADFFQWLEENSQQLLNRDKEALAYAIECSCRNKADIVSQDEREGGVRALLNFGHTFGHAIEAAGEYKQWLHGEAVAAGMVMAADLSVRLGWLPGEQLDRLRGLIERFGLPVAAPAQFATDQLLELMAVDKKATDGGLRLVLLKAIGSAVVTTDYTRDQLCETLNSVRN
ncbi:3-dehydroquinate synthase [Porticoccus sp. W117]|uniref:3-dehydroquinate synthase n=1 Tax=Porticoccus sp. W117 TaxID=3054777 RepID=UPI0025966EFF|nr:3-dehydroquinate synthase [Porticoccus sp. W117]MDM3871549.1 3-dehydroquinate synthase [Porticoccus sp. W117]